MAPPNLKSKEYYEILGVPRQANEADLKKAYRKLAVKVSVDLMMNESFSLPLQKNFYVPST
jgi:preprotein translocase subunit Sec63